MSELQDQVKAMSMLLGQLRQVHATTQRVVGELQAGARAVREAALGPSADGLPTDTINSAVTLCRWATDADAWRRKLGADIHAIAQWIGDAQRYAAAEGTDPGVHPLPPPYAGANAGVRQAYARAAERRQAVSPALRQPAQGQAPADTRHTDAATSERDTAAPTSVAAPPAHSQQALAAAAGALAWIVTPARPGAPGESPWQDVSAHWDAFIGAVVIMTDSARPLERDVTAASLQITTLACQFIQSGAVSALLQAKHMAGPAGSAPADAAALRGSVAALLRQPAGVNGAACAWLAALEEAPAAFDRLYDRARYLSSIQPGSGVLPACHPRELLFARLVQQRCFSMTIEAGAPGGSTWSAAAALLHPLPAVARAADGARHRRAREAAPLAALDAGIEIVGRAAIESGLSSALSCHALGMRGACYALLLSILQGTAATQLRSDPKGARAESLLRHPLALQQHVLAHPDALQAIVDSEGHRALDARLRSLPPLALCFVLGDYVPHPTAVDQLVAMSRAGAAHIAAIAPAAAALPLSASTPRAYAAPAPRLHREIDQAIGSAHARWQLSRASSGDTPGRP